MACHPKTDMFVHMPCNNGMSNKLRNESKRRGRKMKGIFFPLNGLKPLKDSRKNLYTYGIISLGQSWCLRKSKVSSHAPVKLHGKMEVGRFDKPAVKSDLEAVPK